MWFGDDDVQAMERQNVVDIVALFKGYLSGSAYGHVRQALGEVTNFHDLISVLQVVVPQVGDADLRTKIMGEWAILVGIEPQLGERSIPANMNVSEVVVPGEVLYAAGLRLANARESSFLTGWAGGKAVNDNAKEEWVREGESLLREAEDGEADSLSLAQSETEIVQTIVGRLAGEFAADSQVEWVQQLAKANTFAELAQLLPLVLPLIPHEGIRRQVGHRVRTMLVWINEPASMPGEDRGGDGPPDLVG